MKRPQLRLSVRGRLTVLLSGAVLLTTALVWILTGRAVLQPFARDLVRAHLTQVVFVAQEIEQGVDPDKIGDRLGLELRRVRRPPRPVRIERRRGGCRDHRLANRRLIACRPPLALVAVQLVDGSWLLARRALDPEKPQRRVLWVLVFAAIVVIALSAALASRITKPIRTSVSAMDRMAKGDLRHRLPEDSSGEVGEVARAFNRMADRVRTLLEAERSLMASISHELRTPLARLRLELELLREHAVPEKRLAAMESDVADIDRLIGEVLEASKLTMGDRRALGPIDVRAVIEDALGQVDLPYHEVKLTELTDAQQEQELSPPWGDHQRLVRLAKNLLENASKYSPRESTIEIVWSQRSFEIQDQGPGIPKSELPRVFEPFYRGEKGIRAGVPGHGLGLMIAKQIAEVHDAQLDVFNRLGAEGQTEGLAVRFEMPEKQSLEDRAQR